MLLKTLSSCGQNSVEQWFDNGPGLHHSVRFSLHALPASLRLAAFPPDPFFQAKDRHVRLIGGSKLPVSVNVSVYGCLSPYVSLVMNW